MEIRNIETFLPYFETIRERTMRVLEAVPAGKLEWRHTQGVFSPGDLARRIAAVERYTFTENALGRPSVIPAAGRNWRMALRTSSRSWSARTVKPLIC